MPPPAIVETLDIFKNRRPEEVKKNWVKEITENMLRKRKIQEALDTIKSAPVGMKDARKAIEALVGYIENNKGRINYPALESRGYPIIPSVVVSSKVPAKG